MTAADQVAHLAGLFGSIGFFLLVRPAEWNTQARRPRHPATG
jgi:hypothetical protein